MAVMVTGAAGFVGLALCEYLLGRGDDVIAVDLDAMPERAAREFARAKGRLVASESLDVRDGAAFSALLARHRPRALVHLAAMTPLGAVPPALAVRTAEVNIVGVLNAVAAAAAARTGCMVLVSSGAVFGAASHDAPMLDHTIRPDPRTPYGIAKFAGERMGMLAAAEAGLPLAAARLSSVFGRWERATPARPRPSPIVRITEKALAGKPAVLAEAVKRDFIYSADVAAALASLVDHGKTVADPLHVTIDAMWSLPDWCAALQKRIPGFQWTLDPVHPEADGAANDRSPLSWKELAATTGFRARFGMEQAIEDYLAWYRAA
ncbi:MAG: NAD(P)-dependent oxidoreductase [Alphaproteobacteria bacterium]|nr:NAD(P)-dependent oxidoreductase [Alphaproteobacteria bacterium]